MCGRRPDHDSRFAMKTVTLQALGGEQMAMLRNEIDLQRSLDHPNIAKIFEYFVDGERQEKQTPSHM